MDLYNDDERFIPLVSDYGFKATFGNEADTRFLRKALQAFINSPVAIEEITFIQNEIKGVTRDSRSGIYDLFCRDEQGTQFIVEMQLGKYPEFIQRMKFYSFYRLNTLIKRGDYEFDDLPKIYCIGVLAATIFPHIADYHNVAVLKNQHNELIDEQMTFITVELDKFKKGLSDITSNLDKLLYTMKTIHEVSEPTQFPPFWNEEWLRVAIQELDKRALTPEQRLSYEMTISANALAVKNEQKKIQEAEARIKTETVKNALQMGLTVEQSSLLANVSVEFVHRVQQTLLSN
ncbi:Rpn family recombination-promoting nuclease/putative transposase [Fibrella aquatilis]|uniref:Rpn family recombination-promoting nuclease/putative transposase n=1 Tax=Fibrella aquatilis TaxID=2817059 RepID=A0A939G863_9BACT|nr:Rpn family recombination-promoting nuclease/putative transposase [Fibrella aquatilis]MBO0933646.1 Rpn family recombination-promoting nuclease/putative transposase [Fibrella aquatilis]